MTDRKINFIAKDPSSGALDQVVLVLNDQAQTTLRSQIRGSNSAELKTTHISIDTAKLEAPGKIGNLYSIKSTPTLAEVYQKISDRVDYYRYLGRRILYASAALGGASSYILVQTIENMLSLDLANDSEISFLLHFGGALVGIIGGGLLGISLRNTYAIDKTNQETGLDRKTTRLIVNRFSD